MTTSNMNKRSFLLKTAGVALALGASLTFSIAHAQSDRGVRFVLPNATGSGVDAITRAAQPAFAKAFNANVIVENQPGAGGVLGLQTLSKSAPDGTTLSLVSNNVVILPSVLKSLPFNMSTDFTPIATVGSSPLVLVVNPQKISARNNKELIELLKSKPDTYNFASSGTGTILHLATEMYLDQAKVKARHIPYKGVGPMVTDLLGGQVDFGTLALPSVQQHIKSGALVAIGVADPQRIKNAPEIPTFVEQGLPNFVVEAWFAIIGPKGMTPETAKRINQAVVAAFDDPATKAAMERQGNRIDIKSTETTAAYFQQELEKYANLVKSAGIEPQ